MEFLNKVKLAAKSRGIVFVNINTATCKAILKFSKQEMEDQLKKANLTQKEKNKWKYRLEMKALLKKVSKTEGGICKKGNIEPSYIKKVFLSNNGQDKLYKKDSAITLAFQTVDAPENKLDVICVGISAYSTANKARGEQDGAPDPENEFEFKDTEQNVIQVIESGKMFELDVICTSKGSKSTGTLLMLYVFAKEIMRKAKGTQKYKGILMSLARQIDPKNQNLQSYPLRNIVQKLGFKRVEDDPQNQHNLPYYSLLDNDPNKTLEEKMLKSLPNMKEILKFCPTSPRTGLTYCI